VYTFTKLHDTCIPTVGVGVRVGSLSVAWNSSLSGVKKHTVAAGGDAVVGLIFVVDSADQDRIKEAQHELEKVVTSDEMRGVPVEIFANKQDLPSM